MNGHWYLLDNRKTGNGFLVKVEESTGDAIDHMDSVLNGTCETSLSL
jgi:hypothetical protein